MPQQKQDMSQKSGFPLRLCRTQPVNHPAADDGDQKRKIAYFANEFPYLTETFVYREVQAVRGQGVSIYTFSIRQPHPQDLSEEARGLIGNTHYILPASIGSLLATHFNVFRRGPGLYIRILWDILTGSHIHFKDRLRSLAHFIEAVYVYPAVERLNIEHMHAHFAVGAATITWVLARFLKLPFSFTAHAYDIWLDKLLLPEKMHAANFVVTCTAANKEHLVQTYGVPANDIHVIYHGVDIKRFVPGKGKKPASPPRLLAIGRLVEQKGLEYLLHACALLKERNCSFQCEILGDGPLADSLKQLSNQLNLTDSVHFVGRVLQENIIRYYQDADIFVLPCVPASNNDRDGIPNTLMEAMACGVPVVSTTFSGIPELVIEQENGMLVPPKDPEALADALGKLIDNPEMCLKMGQNARQHVEESFSVTDAATSIAKLMDG